MYVYNTFPREYTALSCVHYRMQFDRIDLLWNGLCWALFSQDNVVNGPWCSNNKWIDSKHNKKSTQILLALLTAAYPREFSCDVHAPSNGSAFVRRHMVAQLIAWFCVRYDTQMIFMYAIDCITCVCDNSTFQRWYSKHNLQLNHTCIVSLVLTNTVRLVEWLCINHKFSFAINQTIENLTFQLKVLMH